MKRIWKKFYYIQLKYAEWTEKNESFFDSDEM